MNRFLTIENGKIVGQREDSLNRMVDGEILDDGTYGNVGDVLIDGVWQPDPAEIELKAKYTRLAELEQAINEKKLYNEFDEEFSTLVAEHKAIKAELV